MQIDVEVAAPAEDQGQGTCADPYIIAGLPSRSGLQVFGEGRSTVGAAINYQWRSRPSPDFSYLLLGDCPETRVVTVDNGLAGSGQCIPVRNRWNTELIVFAHSPGICTTPYFPTAPVACCLLWHSGPGHCLNPVPIAGLLPGRPFTTWGSGSSTCNATKSWGVTYNPDFTYRLLGDVAAARTVVVDSCVPGHYSWDTELRVFVDLPGICGQLRLQEEALVAFDDDGSACTPGSSRLVFPAPRGASFLIVVSGYRAFSRCGAAHISVATINTALSPAPPSPPWPPGDLGTCFAPLPIPLPTTGLGSVVSGQGQSTCNARNTWTGPWTLRDFTHLLRAAPQPRIVTVDSCVPGEAAWDTLLLVMAVEAVNETLCLQTSPPWEARDDDSSPCGNARSRVTFLAAANTQHLVVVRAYLSPATVSSWLAWPAIDLRWP
ncbi:hypothetical protein HaLaN_15821 [Haematococcus lacustris]|uniref:Uncharacterized protein n=1 Tax=Haematococcus lacustris TaxID=44745 RepID=A0A699Z8G2_HAELA|nr:hypothetical protein HaLaN_15821 [Haematococcus lacustris]